MIIHGVDREQSTEAHAELAAWVNEQLAVIPGYSGDEQLAVMKKLWKARCSTGGEAALTTAKNEVSNNIKAMVASNKQAKEAHAKLVAAATAAMPPPLDKFSPDKLVVDKPTTHATAETKPK